MGANDIAAIQASRRGVVGLIERMDKEKSDRETEAKGCVCVCVCSGIRMRRMSCQLLGGFGMDMTEQG